MPDTANADLVARDQAGLTAAALSSDTAGRAPARSPARRRRNRSWYRAQVAKSAEQVGFEAVLTPTGTWCEDAWLATAALIGQTSRLKFLVAFRPGLISPTLAAQMAATYQRVSRGWAGARRRRHRPGRQPRAGGRPHRGVRRTRHLGIHPLGLPAPGRGVLVRRGSPARAAQARCMGTPLGPLARRGSPGRVRPG